MAGGRSLEILMGVIDAGTYIVYVEIQRKMRFCLKDANPRNWKKTQGFKEIINRHGYKSCILVTSPYHSRRALRIFTKIMGAEIKIISAPTLEETGLNLMNGGREKETGQEFWMNIPSLYGSVCLTLR